MDIPMDTSKMSEQELQYHYFKMHDADNNNKLDGCELIKSLIHWHEEKEANNPEITFLSDEELSEAVDSAFKIFDEDKDGTKKLHKTFEIFDGNNESKPHISLRETTKNNVDGKIKRKLLYAFRGWIAFVAFMDLGTAIRSYIEKRSFLGDHSDTQFIEAITLIGLIYIPKRLRLWDPHIDLEDENSQLLKQIGGFKKRRTKKCS
ncbi:Multiple coagulation factor deficiency protein 2 like, partial [Pseudolycoriella hygida]